LRSDGILTGVNTINKDNPMLNCRINGIKKYSPHVFILDSKLSINIQSKILNRKNITIFTTVFLNKKKEKTLKHKGINLFLVRHDKNNQVLLKDVIKKLYEQNINNLFIEAGSDINSSFLQENLVDEIILCRSGRVFGNDGRSIINNLNIKEIKDGKNFYFKDSSIIDEDIIEIWGFKE
jgi:diaminohydroxyphosphoribosylaminopyrimidine deaminase/5-amino-6-(5-phosphoribosylamino)uracil reductase